MLKIRVKRITDDEVEITVLPKERDLVPPLSPAADTTTTPEAPPTYSPERVAAEKLRTFLKENGKCSVARCQEFLKMEGLNVERMNFSRVRKYADAHHYQEGGRTWWFPAEPIRAAAVELKKFLADGEHLASECLIHLQLAGFNPGGEREQVFVRHYAGVAAAERDGLSWWSLSPVLVEFAESFDEMIFGEVIEETTWQTS